MDVNNNNISSNRSDNQTSLSNSSSNVDMSESAVKCCGTILKHLMMSDEPGTCANSGYRCVSTQGLQSLNDLRQNNLLCDAVLRLEDGGVFPVHRAILSACSTYFRTLFTTTLHLKNDTDFLVSNVSSKIMNLLLEYAYLRTIDIKQEDVCELLHTADYLVIDGVLELCCDFLRRSLTPKNCIGIMIFAREHFCKDLEKEARRYLLRYFVQVAEQSSEILELPIDELTTLIGEDELNVTNEETAWELALRWIGRDPETRKVHIVELMRNIRLGLMDTYYFLENVKNHHYVAGNEACRPIVIETLKFLYDPEMIKQNKEGELEIATPRVPHDILFAIGGWRGVSAVDLIETYDTRADRWVKVEQIDPLGPRGYHGMAVIGYKIYVIGGLDGTEFFNSCRCFNPVRKTWREIAPMNAKRAYVSVAVLNDMIYAMGGYDGYFRQNSAERYDYRRNQWSLIAPMHMQRSDASATALNGKIYITGGFNGRECMSSAEVYDPEVNQWTMIAPMRLRRSGVSCIAYHGFVYALGGFNGVSRMCCGEKYNPETNTWTAIPDMYNSRSNFAIEIIDDMIFAIGGFNGFSTTFHVECFSDSTNEWYEATDMNTYRSGLAACVVKVLPNVHDYTHKHRERLMEEKRQKLLDIEALQRAGSAPQQQNLVATSRSSHNTLGHHRQ